MPLSALKCNRPFYIMHSNENTKLCIAVLEDISVESTCVGKPNLLYTTMVSSVNIQY